MKYYKVYEISAGMENLNNIKVCFGVFDNCYDVEAMKKYIENVNKKQCNIEYDYITDEDYDDINNFYIMF